MSGKASRFFIFFILIALLLFIPASLTATLDTDEAETRRTGSGHDLWPAAPENRIIHPSPVSPGLKKLAASVMQKPAPFINPVIDPSLVSPGLKKTAASVTQKPVRAFIMPPSMAWMDEAEMRRSGAEHGLWRAAALKNRPVSRVVYPDAPNEEVWLPVGQPMSRVLKKDPVSGDGLDGPPGTHDLPEEVMGMIAAGEPVTYTLNVRGNPVGLDHNIAQRDIKVTFWAPIDKRLEPIAAEHELWLPIHYFKIRRTYYDAGMERYGWDLDYQDRADLWRRVYMTGAGLDGKPAKFERVNEELKYSPAGFKPWRHRTTEPFTNISGGGRISWHWRHAYIVHFEKLQGGSITDLQKGGTKVLLRPELLSAY